MLELQLDSLDKKIGLKLLKSIHEGNKDSIRVAFVESRQAYKKTEWFVEYYAPLGAKELNGAALPEIEIEENKVLPPKGFQVIEEYIYPNVDLSDKEELIGEVKAMQSILGRAKTILESTELSDAHIFNACKQEVFRIIALGITGFDTPIAQTGIQESVISLGSVIEVLNHFGENKNLSRLAAGAIKELKFNNDFNTFDRMGFIVNYANPITTEITQWQKNLRLELIEGSGGLNSTASTLFEPAAFNINYFSTNKEGWMTKEKADLGKRLFSEPTLTGSNRTCKSCHNPALAFTDGLTKSAALIPGTFVKRNAPTLMYAGFQHAQFYDMRSPTLENQAMDVIANKDEMHGSVEEAAKKLSKSENYMKQFKAAFSTMENNELKPRFVMIALASYIRSLSPFNSRFDQYMRGDKGQLSQEEKKGFNLFMGKAKCGTCHFMPLFNGTAPPVFSSTEGEVLGVPVSPGVGKIDPDSGRYLRTKIEQLKYAFKTPTLRNVSKTAPYMHNGAFKTLEQVIDFYDQGGGAGLGIKLEFQTLPSNPLNLSPIEKKEIVAFLKTLTDK